MNLNFSDHITLMLTRYYCKPVFDINTSANTVAKSEGNSTVMHLRLDHADLIIYFIITLVKSSVNTEYN